MFSLFLLFYRTTNLLLKNGESCLHAACNYGHVEAATYLASIHTNLDLQDVVSYNL